MAYRSRVSLVRLLSRLRSVSFSKNGHVRSNGALHNFHQAVTAAAVVAAVAGEDIRQEEHRYILPQAAPLLLGLMPALMRATTVSLHDVTSAGRNRGAAGESIHP